MDEVEQNIVICQWQADQLYAKTERCMRQINYLFQIVNQF